MILHNPFTNAKAFGADKIVTIDIYRMKDGKAAEHRDVIQAVPTEDLANTNGHVRWLQQQLRATRPAMKQPRPGLGRVPLLMTRKEEENVDLIADPEDFSPSFNCIAALSSLWMLGHHSFERTDARERTDA